jgi:succinate dehydrogenase / fumarate reductase flavoprotein subunit
VATRAIHKVVYEHGLGIDGQPMVYLDLTHIPAETLNRKLEGILEIYEKFVGADPLDEPMKIFPAVHYSMGGLWTTFTKDEKTGGLKFGDPKNMSTSITGLYAMGEVNFAYHGANRLGANSLLSCIFDGLFGGTCVRNYINDAAPIAAADVPQEVYDAIVKQEQQRQDWLVNNQGDENPYLLWQEMGKWMTETCTVVRPNERLEECLNRLQDWKARYKRVKLSDTGMWTNQNLSFARAVRDMILEAEAILKGALARNESRGAHYKPAFPDRDDATFLKATLAEYDAATDSAKISYASVDTTLVTPRARTYGKKEAKAEGATSTAASPAVAVGAK